MLLWTTAVDGSHKALLADIKATGYDGVEVPIFAGTPEAYYRDGYNCIRDGWDAA